MMNPLRLVLLLSAAQASANLSPLAQQGAELPGDYLGQAQAAEIPAPGNENAEAAVARLCHELDGLYKTHKWGPQSPCSQIPFHVMGYSVEKRPLLYFETGSGPKLTVLQCGIHGDELPAVPMCFRLIQEILSNQKHPPAPARLIVQPLLNPDGMLRSAKPTRSNANGVDLNRNFATRDWIRDALKSWQAKDHGDPRKYPGTSSFSEPETRAIADFIERVRPQKIISIHTPLGFLDLDSLGGPDKVRRAKYLAINMSKNAGNYRFRSFGFYPGSLGNWAGRERQIPVYTLELPPGDNKTTVDQYWSRFRVSLWRAIKFDLDTGQFSED